MSSNGYSNNNIFYNSFQKQKHKLQPAGTPKAGRATWAAVMHLMEECAGVKIARRCNYLAFVVKCNQEKVDLICICEDDLNRKLGSYKRANAGLNEEISELRTCLSTLKI